MPESLLCLPPLPNLHEVSDLYLYDTHVHSSECSACAHSTAKEMVQAYKAAGFSGFAFTNHFYHGYSAIDRKNEWVDFVRPYYDAYLSAVEEAQRIDFDVFFGIEENIGRGKELLVYNIDFDTLANLPELRHADHHTFVDTIHAAGGFIVHAHPFRFRDYMGEYFEPDFYGCDGVEVFNFANTDDENERAAKAAVELGLVPTAGMDNHHMGLVPDSGMIFTKRARTAKQFVAALCSPDTKLLRRGK